MKFNSIDFGEPFLLVERGYQLYPDGNRFSDSIQMFWTIDNIQQIPNSAHYSFMHESSGCVAMC